MSAVPRRRVLIVAVEFPPAKGIGRLRPLKFCQHLQGLGWDAAVLTLAEGDMQPVDRATLDEIPTGTPVYRVALPRPRDRVIRGLKRLLGRAPADGCEDPATREEQGGTKQPASFPAREGGRLDWARRMVASVDRFVHRHLQIPDDLVLWWPPAVRQGAKVVEEFRPDVILATAPHFTSLIVGARLSRKTGVPWVADYRDLWTGDVLRAWVPAWRQRLELALERRVVTTAGAVVTVSGPKTEVMRKRLPGLADEDLVTITNGYDPEEFEGVAAEGREPGVLRIVYAGRLFKNRRGYELLEAAGALIRERPELAGCFRFEYYGGRAPEIVARMDELLASHGLEQTFCFFPDVAYARSKALQKGADVLLLIVDGGETTSGVIPGKLFEYIAAGRPILCVAEDGATPEIIRRGRLGWVERPGDVEGIKARLAQIVDATDPFPTPDAAYVRGFERRHLVSRLAQVLERVAGKRSS
ncbi:glycosyltransferase [Ectothiorhodospira variabilis]|uniref:glycosyltransferase n=1 Tax=Ectothiorhodospira variabilis TaxID=505694 RepID=UPI001EFBC602|nr:glycosyltransferase [Ectothiorhodospira variabilis]MCG5497532.1 glycosyltransferase [Ectothiorhodospira variabilis]